jgi:anti-anti-sigma regulatory factor
MTWDRQKLSLSSLVTLAPFSISDTVALCSARAIAAEIEAHIRNSAAPCIDARGLRQSSLPLLQILVAARQMSAQEGKSFVVQIEAGSALAAQLAQLGLDPVLCGIAAEPAPPAAQNFH